MSSTLWLTGFGAFPGMPCNPTAALVERMDGRLLSGLTVVAEVLPTSYERARERVIAGHRQLRPALTLHLGVAADEHELRLETQAVNERHSTTPDVDGELGRGQPCMAELPLGHVLQSTADAHAIAETLVCIGLSARSSNDAGRYVCNSTYFASLWAAARSTQPAPVVFLHVPPVGAERGERGERGERWLSADLDVAVMETIAALAAHLRAPVADTKP